MPTWRKSSAGSTAPINCATTWLKIWIAFFSTWLAPRHLPNPGAPLHSESPGLIVDRLSILALKIYHTREEAERTDAPAGHEERNRSRLAILEEQRADLAHCLDALWRDTLAGTRRFKLYRQLKMYNDPSSEPRNLQQVAGRFRSLIACCARRALTNEGVMGIKRAYAKGTSNAGCVPAR